MAYLLQLSAWRLKSERSVRITPMRKHAIVQVIRELCAHTNLSVQITDLDSRISAKISRKARTKIRDWNLLLIRTVHSIRTSRTVEHCAYSEGAVQ